MSTHLTKFDFLLQSVRDHGDCDECLEWPFARYTKRGNYGYLKIHGAQLQTHRVAYEQFRGPIPQQLWVLHKCDNPPCYSPKHLFLGTRIDNMRDAASKGRLHGGKSDRQKLHPKQVIEIRKLYSGGAVTLHQLAALFEVSPSSIHDIVRFRSWKHVIAPNGSAC